jgi:hypothetical protein
VYPFAIIAGRRTASSSPSNRSPNACASSGFAKQNTATSSRRIEYVSGATDRLSAKERFAVINAAAMTRWRVNTSPGAGYRSRSLS